MKKAMLNSDSTSDSSAPISGSTTASPSGAVAGLSIRTMTLDELEIAISWAAQEGWNPGLSDARTFYAADPGGFFVAELDGKPVGCISAVRYGDDFGFLGLYIVKPDHRGRGYGMALWNHAMEQLNGRNIGLDGVVAQQANYAASGFKLAHRNIRYELQLGADLAATLGTNDAADSELIPLTRVDPASLAAYDRQMFLYPRQAFLQEWITQQGAVAFAGVNPQGAVQGYAVMRPCGTGHKIGPLFADSAAIARDLFSACIAAAKDGPVYLDVPEPNRAAIDLVTRHGMTPMFETARMYTRVDPGLPLDRIYGISSFELG